MAETNNDDDARSNKRSHADFTGDDGSDSSSDDDMGPQLPSAAPKKKRRVLPFEKLYFGPSQVDALFQSLMHKEPLAFVTMTR
ncbi:hypothetical protein NEMBOFW57_002385 [Staphylotrichum longicolle]|uniref:Uncharacterized protein n=1 Tax=Staphylotrichum longicolle TaxID=669026 RepID=A0AAD4I3K4_9PEZI|nr:hypothetical protein NEMBOFW57_002385 [Staphylotrichum longicolle]